MTAFKTSSSLTTKSKLLAKASSIYSYTHQSASSLLVAFDDAKAKRGNPRGVLTDQEQDILRAALVMSCAGLDAALKQAIRDSLQHLVSKSRDVQDKFEKFIQKRLSGDDGQVEVPSGAKFLASLLAAPDLRSKLIEAYIIQLTGDSLQSADEVLRTLAALGVDPKGVPLDVPRLKSIFTIRNKIIHELDIDLAARMRKRKVRSQGDLLANSDHVLKTTRAILEQIDRAAQ
jgi:hypothetical protein